VLDPAVQDRTDPAAGLAVVPAGALGLPGGLVPMAGSWSATDGVLRFLPRLPFAHGITYVLVRSATAPGAATSWVELGRLQRPATCAPSTAVVAAINPAVAEVPQNLLRLAVTFSAAMEEGSAAGHVHLRDPAGQDLEHALLPMPPELWDMPRRRLTLLLEPGRIKRGLVPNTQLGPPLVQGTTFDLVVDAAIRDAAGGTLAADGHRAYHVGPAIRSRVDPRNWHLTWPAPHSEDALVVVFDRPMDHALALRCLTVTDAQGDRVPGSATLDEGERRWSFTPHPAARTVIAALHVDTALEDLAGNSVRRVFDRDLRVEADDPGDLAQLVLTPQRPGGR
jgi:hypothetical protein